jgi:hypothetical protein
MTAIPIATPVHDQVSLWVKPRLGGRFERSPLFDECTVGGSQDRA